MRVIRVNEVRIYGHTKSWRQDIETEGEFETWAVLSYLQTSCFLVEITTPLCILMSVSITSHIMGKILSIVLWAKRDNTSLVNKGQADNKKMRLARVHEPGCSYLFFHLRAGGKTNMSLCSKMCSAAFSDFFSGRRLYLELKTESKSVRW